MPILIVGEITLDVVVNSNREPDLYMTVGGGTAVGSPGVSGAVVLDSGLTNATEKSQYTGFSMPLEADYISPVFVGVGVDIAGNGNELAKKFGTRFGSPGITVVTEQFNWTFDIGR